MPLVSSAMETQLTSILSGSGWVGPDMPLFSTAIATGVITALIGTAFQTVEVGSAGPGVGSGVGVLGVEAPVIDSSIFLEALSAGMNSTPDLKILTGAIGSALGAQLKLGTLAAISEKVVGTATIVPGSFSVSGSSISGSVFQIGVSLGFIGQDFKTICDAIGAGIQLSFGSGTGNLILAGTPAVPTVPVPAPGVPGTGLLT